MDNIRISELPEYSGSASGSYLVINDSSQSNTYKVTRETLLSGYTSSYSVNSITSSYAITASYAVQAVSSSLLGGLASSAYAKLNVQNLFTRDLSVFSGSREIGFWKADTWYSENTLNGAEIGISNQENVPLKAGMYVSSGSNYDYLTAIEIPNGPDFIQPHGLIRFHFPVESTGSVSFSSLINLAPQDPLLSGSLGSLATSGSNLYFHDGSTWRQVQLV